MTTLLALPIAIPLATAALTLAARRSLRAQRALGLLGATGLLAAAAALVHAVWTDGVQVLHVGGWAAPLGITLVADGLSAAMVLVTAVVGVAVSVYGLAREDRDVEASGHHPLLHVLLMGVSGAFVTGDLFNLYVWFEVLLIASFSLLVLGGGRERLRGALPYVAINLVSSASFLAAVGLLYGLTGTLNMADLAVRLAQTDSPGLVTAVAGLFVIAFGIKAALFPLYFWLPASYHTPPVVVTAVFAGLLTKVGVYAFLRTFTLLFTQDVGWTHGLLLVVAGATMLSGVLGAVVQTDVRKILSFHIVSQIGYMLMGLALFTPLALAGAVFYVVHHIVVKTNLFLVAGLVHRVGGSFSLDRLGGLYASHPWLAVLFLVPALSLAGLPPLSGFWAKLTLIDAGLQDGAWAIVAVALVAGALTLYSMTKIWVGAFWKPAPEDAPAARPAPAALIAPVAALAAVTVVMGLWAEPFMAFAQRAADGLLDPTAYIQAVLEARP